MVKKSKRRSRHIPRRTCVGCREVLPKRALIRIVRTDSGVMVDPTGKTPGRGAYLHDQRSCWEQGVKGALDHALKAKLTDAEKRNLMHYFENRSANQVEEVRSEDLSA